MAALKCDARKTEPPPEHALARRVHSKIIAQGPRWRCTRPVRAGSNRTVYIAYTRAGCIVWEHSVPLSFSPPPSPPPPRSTPVRLVPHFLFLPNETHARPTAFMRMQLGCVSRSPLLNRGDKYNARIYDTRAHTPRSDSSWRQTRVTAMQIIEGASGARRRNTFSTPRRERACTWTNSLRAKESELLARNSKSFVAAH